MPKEAQLRFDQKPAPPSPENPNQIFPTSDWDFAGLHRMYDEIEKIAIGEFGLDIYPVQIEVITSEQMLDAYSSVGLPLMYRHWSFGKRFAYHETLYRRGLQGLAYEIIINSNPVLCYIMEENSSLMQTLVMAHAGMGHNHFFKNNYLFREWTDAEGILDYLAFAKRYVEECEEKHGVEAVTRILDAAHALKEHGVDRYKRHSKPNLKEEERRQDVRREELRLAYNDLFEKTVPKKGEKAADASEEAKRQEELKQKLGLPEENILYFFEKKSPNLKDWERELLRIVRNISQYFYPQKQLQMMNEGCASFCHYMILYRLWEKGFISEGQMQEFLHSHSSVVFQPGFDDPRFSGINPYALGFAMMQDLYNICTGHVEANVGEDELARRLAEDREYFSAIAYQGEPPEEARKKAWALLRDAWANYRDESFVRQYLSPRVTRQFRFFVLDDDSSKSVLKVDAIQDEAGFKPVRTWLAKQYNLANREPDIQVVDAALYGDRLLTLAHYCHDGVLLEEKTCKAVLRYAARLWGYGVKLLELEAETDKVLKTHEVNEKKGEPK